MDYKIKPMKESDWEQVAEIYLDGIQTEIATFQSEAPTWEDWDKGHVVDCRFVARVEDNILGWVAMSPVSSRCVYAGVAEVSVYVHKEYKGMGVGTTLLNHVIEESEKLGFWTLQSGIIKENTASRLLHKKCGFREIGYRERVGKMKNGTWHDVVLMERRSKNIENE
jgi:phosphinothricin acetyltransferase